MSSSSNLINRERFFKEIKETFNDDNTKGNRFRTFFGASCTLGTPNAINYKKKTIMKGEIFFGNVVNKIDIVK